MIILFLVQLQGAAIAAIPLFLTESAASVVITKENKF